MPDVSGAGGGVAHELRVMTSTPVTGAPLGFVTMVDAISTATGLSAHDPACTIGVGLSTCSDTVNAFFVTAGDALSVFIEVFSGSTFSGYITWSLNFDSP